jgi:hypothetical protein
MTKNGCSNIRVAFASVFGACFAVLFSLVDISGAVAIIIKIAAGFIICLIGGKFQSVKGFIKFVVAFFILTFVSGGLLFAVFSLADIDYSEGNGFVLSSVPVGIPLFCVLMLALGAKKLVSQYISKRTKNKVSCRIYAGQFKISASGFYDSGNKVYDFGQPVSVMPKSLAERLVNVESLTCFTYIHTAAGSKLIPVFTADKIEIDDGSEVIIKKNVKVGVSEEVNKLILHPDMAEVD